MRFKFLYYVLDYFPNSSGNGALITNQQRRCVFSFQSGHGGELSRGFRLQVVDGQTDQTPLWGNATSFLSQSSIFKISSYQNCVQHICIHMSGWYLLLSVCLKEERVETGTSWTKSTTPKRNNADNINKLWGLFLPHLLIDSLLELTRLTNKFIFLSWVKLEIIYMKKAPSWQF